MNRSTSIEALSKALVALQGEMPAVTKSHTNPHYKSKFASLDDIITAIREPLKKNGLGFTQQVCGSLDEVGARSGLMTTLWHESGEWISSIAPLPQVDDPQKFGALLTYYRRFTLGALLGIATEDDDDGEVASDSSSAPTRVVRGGGKTAAEGSAESKIVEAAKLTDNAFLSDLAAKVDKGYTLNEKQLSAGVKQADAVLAKRASEATTVLTEELGAVELDGTEAF